MKRAVVLLLIVLWLAAACGIGESPAQTPIPPTAAPPSPVVATAAFETDGSSPSLVLLGTLIDGTGADPLPDAALVIQGDRIVAVGPRAEVSLPPGAQIVELPQATILPGFINTHVHNAYNAHNLQIWARAGVTTVRDLGERLGRTYFTIRDRLRANPLNARLIAAGPLVTVPGGYPIAGNDFPSLTVTSPEDARQKIEQLIDDGADVIKITLTSGRAPSLSPEEAAAIVETAHERGIPVTAHATTAQDLRRALDAGVDDVAHIAVDRVPDQVIRKMVDAGVSWVPTFDALENRGQANLRRFIKAGGRVALGNDAGYLAGLEVGMPMREIQAMHDAGMTPMQIIVASTRDAAYVCHRLSTLGTLEAGKYADVLVVDGDPLQDLRALKNVRMVVHSGAIVREPVPTTTPALPTQPAAPSAAPLSPSPTAVPPTITPTAVATSLPVAGTAPVPPTSTAKLPTPADAPSLEVISVDTADRVELLCTLSGHRDRVTALAFSGDGAHLASSGRDKTIILWDVRSGREVSAFSMNEVDLNGIDFSPDGSLLASAEAIWDVESKQVVHPLERGLQAPGHVAFSPDGSTLAVAVVNQPIKLWDVASGQVVRSFDRPPDDAPFFSIAFSPDGALLAASRRDGTVKVWDVGSGQISGTLEHGNGSHVHDVAFSPDGSLLASAGTDYTVRLWDVTSRQVMHTLRHSDGLYGVTFSPDGSLLASAGCDRTVKLWDVGSGRLVRSLGHGDEVMAVAFSPDGTLLASAGYDHQVYLWGVAR